MSKTSNEDLIKTLHFGLKSIEYLNIIKRGDIVSIKVNLCDSAPKKGVITSPDIVYDTISIIKNRAAEIYVVESDGLLYSADKAARNSGILDVVKQTGAEFINLTKDKKVQITFNDTLYVKKLKMPKTLLKSDVFISIPVPKTHEITIYTGALKNQFGCYPQRNRILLHPNLDKAIVDINKILNPRIIIMDARIAIEGNGPTRGFPVKLNLLLVSNNPVLCDGVMIYLMSLPLNKINHVLLAWKYKLGPLIPFKFLRDKIGFLKRPFKLPHIDIGVTFQKITLMNPITVRILYNTPLTKYIVRGGRIIRRRTLQNKTYYF